MRHLARIKLPFPIRLAISPTFAKSALMVVNVLIFAHSPPMPKEVPSTPALTRSKASSPALSRRLQVWLQL